MLVEVQRHRVRQLNTSQHVTVLVRQNQSTAPCRINVHPSAIFVADGTHLLQWVNRTCIGSSGRGHYTCDGLAFGLQAGHGLL
ncbi:hypothetical protein D3C72_2015950 [compost metagenome]